MYSTLQAVRFSVDHQTRIEVHCKSEPSEYVYDLMDAIGVKWFVKQPEIRSRIGLPEVNFRSYEETERFERESRDTMLAVLAASAPVLWVIFGDHSFYSFRFTDSNRKPPRFLDAWLTGFVVID